MTSNNLVSTYTLDLVNGSRVLTSTTAGLTTRYLYARGPLAEYENGGWSYSLTDRAHLVRQVTDADGEALFAVRYSPWGEVLWQSGSDTLVWGYLGGWSDAASGLVYVGNGQYYDPKTGRFLTRQGRSGSANPYLPDLTGALLGPLSLAALFVQYRKDKRGKTGRWVAFILLTLTVAAVGAACSAGADGGISPTCPPATLTRTLTPGTTPTNTSSAIPPTKTITPIFTPISTLIPATTSGYYIPTESQARKYGGGNDIPIPAPKWASGPYLIKKEYRTTDLEFSHNWVESPAQYANEALLFDHNYICLQGSGQLDNGEFITCDNPDGLWWDGFANADAPIRNSIAFLRADNNKINSLVPFKTVAVCDTSTIKGKIQLRGLENNEILKQNGNPEAIFDVVDVGQGLCPKNSSDGNNHVDIFTGLGEQGFHDATQFFGKPVEIYTINSGN